MSSLSRAEKQRLIAEAIVYELTEMPGVRTSQKLLAKVMARPKKFQHPQSFRGSLVRTTAKAAAWGALAGATKTAAPEWQTQVAGATLGALGAAAAEYRRRKRQANIARQWHQAIQKRKQAQAAQAPASPTSAGVRTRVAPA